MTMNDGANIQDLTLKLNKIEKNMMKKNDKEISTTQEEIITLKNQKHES
jgi:hypothetical protein